MVTIATIVSRSTSSRGSPWSKSSAVDLDAVRSHMRQQQHEPHRVETTRQERLLVGDFEPRDLLAQALPCGLEGQENGLDQSVPRASMSARHASMLASTDPAELVVWLASKPRSRRSRSNAAYGAHEARWV